MRKLLLLCVVTLLWINLFADQAWDSPVRIREALNVDFTGTTARTSEGNIIYVWSDLRASDRDIYAMKVSHAGAQLWPAPIAITTSVGQQDFPVIIPLGGDEFAIAYMDYRDYHNPIIRANKINSAGEVLWGNEGIMISDNPALPPNYKITALSNGDILFTWMKLVDSQPNVYGQKLSSSGSILWNPVGIRLTHAAYSTFSYNIVANNNGGFVIAYYIRSDIYKALLMPFNYNGQPQAALPIDIAPEIASHNLLGTIQIPGNMFAVAYYFLASNQNQIFLRYYNYSAVPVGEPIQIAQLADNQSTLYGPRFLSSDGTILFCWRQGSNPVRLHAQKLTMEGDLLWGDEGVLVAEEQEWQLNPLFVPDNDGGVFFAWEKNKIYASQYELMNRIAVKHINSSGQQVYHTEEICADRLPLLVRTAYFKDDVLHLAWDGYIDASIECGIRIQTLNANGVPQLEENGSILVAGMPDQYHRVPTKILKHDYGTTVLWVDTREPFNDRIYYQIIDPEGNILLSENGEFLDDGLHDTRSWFQADQDEAGNAFVLWGSSKTDPVSVRAQLISPAGVKLWGEDGLLVLSDEYSSHAYITSYEDGAFYIIWARPHEYKFRVFGQKIQNGELQWGADGIELLPEIVNGYAMFPKAMVGRHILLDAIDIEDPTLQRIYIHKFNPDGSSAWPQGGIYASNYEGADAISYRSQAIMDGDDLVVFWVDFRGDYLDKLYMQRISSSGEHMWNPQGVQVTSRLGSSGYSITQYDGALYLFWEESFLLMSKSIDATTGITIWEQDSLFPSTTRFVPESITAFDNGSFLIASYFSEAESFLSYNYMNSSGTILNPGGNQLSLTSGSAYANIMVSGSGSRAYLSWAELIRKRRIGYSRESYLDFAGIYVQAFDSQPVSNPQVDSPAAQVRLLQNYPNPFNPSTTIAFELAETGHTSLGIYNMRGQLVRTLINEHLISGRHSSVWDGKDSSGHDVSSGIYFYRLKSGRLSSSKKMILMK